MIEQEQSPNVKVSNPHMYNSKNFYIPSEYVECSEHNDVIILDIKSKSLANLYNRTFEHYFTWYKDYGLTEHVDIHGLPNLDNKVLGGGSDRFSAMSSSLAEHLTRLIKENINFEGFLQVADYFRFMKYVSGGEHFPHYDSDYEFEDSEHITKYSMVLYHNDLESGQLAFVTDPRLNHNNTDWDRQAEPDEIWLSLKPKALRLVIFPHTLCHTVLPYNDKEDRNIIRGDLIFKK